MTWPSFSELLLNRAFKGWFGFAWGLSLFASMIRRNSRFPSLWPSTSPVYVWILGRKSGEEPSSSQSNTTAPLIDAESCIMSLTGRFWASLKVVPTVLRSVYLHTLFLFQTIMRSAVTGRYRLTMLMTKLGTSILLFWLTTGTPSIAFLDPRQRESLSKFRKGPERMTALGTRSRFENLQQHVNARVNLVISIDTEQKKKRKSDLVFSYWTQASGERIKRLQRVFGFFFFPERSFRLPLIKLVNAAAKERWQRCWARRREWEGKKNDDVQLGKE